MAEAGTNLDPHNGFPLELQPGEDEDEKEGHLFRVGAWVWIGVRVGVEVRTGWGLGLGASATITSSIDQRPRWRIDASSAVRRRGGSGAASAQPARMTLTGGRQSEKAATRDASAYSLWSHSSRSSPISEYGPGRMRPDTSKKATPGSSAAALSASATASSSDAAATAPRDAHMRSGGARLSALV